MLADEPWASKLQYGLTLCRSWSVNSNIMMDKLLFSNEIAAMGELQFSMLVYCNSMLVYCEELPPDPRFAHAPQSTFLVLAVCL